MEAIAEILMETRSAKQRYSREICGKYCLLMWEKAVCTLTPLKLAISFISRSVMAVMCQDLTTAKKTAKLSV